MILVLPILFPALFLCFGDYRFVIWVWISFRKLVSQKRCCQIPSLLVFRFLVSLLSPATLLHSDLMKNTANQCSHVGAKAAVQLKGRFLLSPVELRLNWIASVVSCGKSTWLVWCTLSASVFPSCPRDDDLTSLNDDEEPCIFIVPRVVDVSGPAAPSYFLSSVVLSLTKFFLQPQFCFPWVGLRLFSSSTLT